MSRRTLTLALAGFLVVVLAAIAALLPVPYVAISPGPVTNTLGSVGKHKLIQIEGHETYPTKGRLDLTTISAFGGPTNRLDLVTALRGWVDDQVAVVPEEQIYPAGQTAEQIEEESAAEMTDSQSSATTAALRHLGIPVTTKVFVTGLAPDSPARGKLKKGDQLLELDGKKVVDGDTLRELVTAHDPGDKIPLVVQRDGDRLPLTVTTMAAEDGRTVIGITTRDDPTYPFSIKFGLEDVGGPSAGTMFALGIVDMLTPGPLTGGKHIAGTGTIDADGEVGVIGGIPQKMAGAKRAGATVFLAPSGNCAEAARTKPDGLRLVRVKTLTDAVESLDKIREGRSGVPTC